MAQNTLRIFYLSSASLSSLFHLCGIMLLYRMTGTPNNQKLLIINLSCSELLFSLELSAHTILKMLNSYKHPAFVIFDWIVILTSTTANKLLILYLVLDRFADIYLHMRYPLFFTKTRVVKILVALWMFAFVHGTVTSVVAIWANDFKDPLEVESEYVQSYNYFTLIIDAAITVSAVTTYLYFYSKVSSIVKRTKSQAKQRHQGMNRNQMKKFLIPFLMVATYLMFNVSSNVLFTIRRQWKSLKEDIIRILLSLGWTFTMVGYISDAVLYIFLQKSVRNSIASFFRKNHNLRSERVPPRIATLTERYLETSKRN